MFSIVITSATAKAMLHIDPGYSFKCHMRPPICPGEDPLAVMMGLRWVYKLYTWMDGCVALSLFAGNYSLDATVALIRYIDG